MVESRGSYLVRTTFFPAIETCRKNDEAAVTQIELALEKLV